MRRTRRSPDGSCAFYRVAFRRLIRPLSAFQNSRQKGSFCRELAYGETAPLRDGIFSAPLRYLYL